MTELGWKNRCDETARWDLGYVFIVEGRVLFIRKMQITSKYRDKGNNRSKNRSKNKSKEEQRERQGKLQVRGRRWQLRIRETLVGTGLDVVAATSKVAVAVALPVDLAVEPAIALVTGVGGGGGGQQPEL